MAILTGSNWNVFQITKKIPLSEIERREDLSQIRAAEHDPEVISKMAADIAKNGLLKPIVVWWDEETGGWVLIDGSHRFLAWQQLFDNEAKKNGVTPDKNSRTTIPVREFKFNPDVPKSKHNTIIRRFQVEQNRHIESLCTPNKKDDIIKFLVQEIEDPEGELSELIEPDKEWSDFNRLVCKWININIKSGELAKPESKRQISAKVYRKVTGKEPLDKIKRPVKTEQVEKIQDEHKLNFKDYNLYTEDGSTFIVNVNHNDIRNKIWTVTHNIVSQSEGKLSFKGLAATPQDIPEIRFYLCANCDSKEKVKKARAGVKKELRNFVDYYEGLHPSLKKRKFARLFYYPQLSERQPNSNKSISEMNIEEVDY